MLLTVPNPVNFSFALIKCYFAKKLKKTVTNPHITICFHTSTHKLGYHRHGSWSLHHVRLFIILLSYKMGGGLIGLCSLTSLVVKMPQHHLQVNPTSNFSPRRHLDICQDLCCWPQVWHMTYFSYWLFATTATGLHTGQRRLFMASTLKISTENLIWLCMPHNPRLGKWK